MLMASLVARREAAELEQMYRSACASGTCDVGGELYNGNPECAEDALPEHFEVANADNPCFDLLTKKLGKRLQL